MDYFQHVKFEKPMAYPNGDVQEDKWLWNSEKQDKKRSFLSIPHTENK